MKILKDWCCEHPIIIEDMDEVVSDSVIPWKALENTVVLVTGATGLIGSHVVKTLLYAADKLGLKVNVCAVVRNIAKAEKVFAGQKAFWGNRLSFYKGDVRAAFPQDMKADYIIHAASATASLEFISRPVDVIDTTLDGTRSILQLAHQSASRSVVYISSMEVYGALDHARVCENESGYINPLAVRSSYPQSKRMAETLCVAYFTQYGVPVKIVRPTLTFGAGVPETDNRVYAQFARSALSGTDIVLHTLGMTKRDYIYTSDAVRSILSVLFLGENGKAYNLSNVETYSTIREMAELVSTMGEGCRVVFDCDEEKQKQYASEIQIQLDDTKCNALNKFHHKSLQEMFERMMTVMRDTAVV